MQRHAGPVAGRPYSLCLGGRTAFVLLPSAGAQFGRPDTGPLLELFFDLFDDALFQAGDLGL